MKKDLTKHIQKKFHNELTMTEELEKQLTQWSVDKRFRDWSAYKNGTAHIRDIPKGFRMKTKMDSGKVLDVFRFKFEGKWRLIPEPDPILIYFNTAYINLLEIEKRKANVLERTQVQVLNEGINNDLYNYFGISSSCIILLFTAMEAFINRAIPNNYVYANVRERRTESYTKDQIHWLSFDLKLKEILPAVTGKNFAKAHPSLYSVLLHLKEYRDEIVHTKERPEGQTPFDYLFIKSFRFNYRKALNAVKDFCNFYHSENYITECSCNQVW